MKKPGQKGTGHDDDVVAESTENPKLIKKTRCRVMEKVIFLNCPKYKNKSEVLLNYYFPALFLCHRHNLQHSKVYDAVQTELLLENHSLYSGALWQPLRNTNAISLMV